MKLSEEELRCFREQRSQLVRDILSDISGVEGAEKITDLLSNALKKFDAHPNAGDAPARKLFGSAEEKLKSLCDGNAEMAERLSGAREKLGQAIGLNNTIVTHLKDSMLNNPLPSGSDGPRKWPIRNIFDVTGKGR